MGICSDFEYGLVVDFVFFDEIVVMCDVGCLLCEFMQFVLDVNEMFFCYVLVVLFYIVYIYVYLVSGVVWLVIEVNLCYVVYYWWMLGFCVCVEVWFNLCVQVLVVLMMLDFSYVEEQVEIYGGRFELMGQICLLYLYFYLFEEELVIFECLCEGVLFYVVWVVS